MTVLPEHRAQTLLLIRSKLDHDLRSNLNVILGYCTMVTEDLLSEEDPTQLAADLGYITAAGKELLYLNNQVGDLLQIQQGKWRLAPTELVVDYVAQDAINEVSERFPSNTFVLDGTATIKNGDARTTGRLLCWLLTQLCKTTSIPSTIELNVQPMVDAAVLDVNCLIDEAQESERRKLSRTLATLLETVPVLNRIQDFDGYYKSVMCELAGAVFDADPDTWSCRVTFSGTSDIAEEPDSEIIAG